MKLKNYYKNPEIVSVNTMGNRSYYLPFSSKDTINDLSNSYDESINLKGLYSDRVLDLNGDWYFSFYNNPLEVPENFITGEDKEDMDITPVPSLWQIEGYDKHQYTNVHYPFPFDPPYVPRENPTGAYIKEFYLDKEDITGKKYLYFEGVDSCHYVWINGEFVGYSEVSHSSSEFDITDKVVEGINTLAVIVLKWCSGSYLEDQDKLRMSGIFRDVYIINRPENHVFDYFVKTDLSEDLSSVDINIDFISVVGNPNIKCTLIYDDEEVENKSVINNKITFNVKNPQLWNAEEPNLYTLLIETEDEAISQFVGVRRIDVKDGVLYFNNKIIKLKGVNRHDSDPFTGYSISREQYMDDIAIMKEHNINAIRTSHYPNAPWFSVLCDLYGFYVMLECDMETHGTVDMYGNGADATGRSTYSVMPELKEYDLAIMDRIQKGVMRDKNCPSIFSWSLCNESGWGPSLEKAGQWIKDFDDSRLIHAETSIYVSDEYRSSHSTSMVDMFSRMYATVKDVDEYFNDPTQYYTDKERIKPYVLCEYIHAMGNGPGDIEDYQEVIEKHDGMMGGFVWEWTDHGVYMGQDEKTGKDKFFYGGDFGEFPHDGNFCMDGLVYPDRRIHTGLLEFKNVIRPIRAYEKNLLAGEIILENKMSFTDIGEKFYGIYEIRQNGVAVSSGKFDIPSIMPREKGDIKLPLDLDMNGKITIVLYYVQKEDDLLTDEGHISGFDELTYKDEPLEIIINDNGKDIEVNDDDRFIILVGENFKYIYDKWEATFKEIVKDNNNVMEKPMEYNIFRAPTDNDRNIRVRWQHMGYDRHTVRVYDTNVSSSNNSVVIKSKLSIGAIYIKNILEMDVSWTVSNGGDITFNVIAKRDPKMPFLPRFGLRMFMKDDYQDVDYIGYGPYESYSDKRRASYFGQFTETVDNLHEDYTKPQENGSHYDCNYLKISRCPYDKVIVESKDNFSFNVSKYTQEELLSKKHNWEIEKSGYTVLCVDYKQSGIGSNSCGPALIDKYRFDEENFTWSVVLSF